MCEIFCDAADKDEGFRAEFSSAQKTERKAERRNDDNEESCLGVQDGRRAETYYQGLRAKTFQEQFGCSFNETGFKVQDLHEDQGK